ncbi:hypothetical protein OF829_01085 [Sphingomonas sp. LB-2]|uniref:hypothetical protein n=1 Tax=Sphingomonas caeni TaxID=2984949 RepID=UPI00222F6672|nr:hypothetical protein [Sphingomonas caeni]MCW3845816.1 hypothetical protein [Sphingomonas caeni]
MAAWRLSIISPTLKVEVRRRLVARQGPLLAAAGALGSALLLGWSSPAPLLAINLTLIGMAGVAGLGLLAYLFARLTVAPLADPRVAALAAALIPPALFPGVGVQALIIPVFLSLWLAWRRSDQRVVALMVQCGALVGLVSAAGGDPVNHFIFATMHGIALFFILNCLDGSANDNPSMERMGGETWLPQNPRYARAVRFSESGSGE